MEAHAGDFVCRRHDDMGVLEVVDDGATRTLYFGTSAKQSSMLLTNPRALTLSYTRAMCACLLFRPTPQRVLLVGLGGGSLARFFLHHFPACRIDAIEPRPAVTQIAREFFALANESRLSIIASDGMAFLTRRPVDSAGYDLILVDAFDAQGMAAGIDSDDFFYGCRRALNDAGVLAVNLWATAPGNFRRAAKRLGRTFDDQVLRLPVEQRGNIITLAFPHPMEVGMLKTLRAQALELEQRHGLEFTALLRGLRRHNTSVLQRMFR